MRKQFAFLLVAVLFHDVTFAFNIFSKTLVYKWGISSFKETKLDWNKKSEPFTLRSQLPKLMMSKNIPRDIKETINQLRQSMQSGLSARCSRMDIELPYAVNFGIERSTQTSQACLNLPHLVRQAHYTASHVLRDCLITFIGFGNLAQCFLPTRCWLTKMQKLQIESWQGSSLKCLKAPVFPL